jgi:starch synthase (maltosyl-transferring)
MDQETHSPPARIVIAGVTPEIEAGRSPIKRVPGESVTVTADIFAEGHGLLSAVVRWRRRGNGAWIELPMRELGNDRWTGTFTVSEPGEYEYTLQAWSNEFETWRRDTKKNLDAGQDVSIGLITGADLVEGAIRMAVKCGAGGDALKLQERACQLRVAASLRTLEHPAIADSPAVTQFFSDENLGPLITKYSERRASTGYERCLPIVVERLKARFSSWYEMFPRSWAKQPGRHGTFRDCEAALPYIANMGFDVLYLPPIHPIGITHRKGKNNSPIAQEDDVGSPWAIGSAEGGHKSIHPQLGTLEDFKHLLARAREYGLEVALDIAFQCSPDHPYVKSHPEWFRRRPDGTIQYAENPPKKYEDIYPFDFGSEDWQALWDELKSVVSFWLEQGVQIFRVDNPHTKPFPFWEWLIGEIKKENWDALFLSEAFTRPKVMQRLAKLGFTQSYTYFAWRNTKWELTEYFTELTQTDLREYFRPNLWPNTPDILTEYLQRGGRPAFMARLVLAATLGASYGIYGAAFELCENRALVPGKEEYLDAEKYQIRKWDLESPASVRQLVARVNQARRQNRALQTNSGLRFERIDNDQLIAYTKSSDDGSNIVLVVVNLDPRYTQSGWVELPLEELRLNAYSAFPVHDLLADTTYLWNGPRNYVQLDPHVVPAHVFVVKGAISNQQTKG